MPFQITQDELQDINQQVEDERFIRVLRQKEEVSKYNKAYRAAKRRGYLNNRSRGNDLIIPINVTTIENIPEENKKYFFKGETEDICCEEFGCPKILSMREKMFGNRCINHPKNQNL
jgi:hypothetical protein